MFEDSCYVHILFNLNDSYVLINLKNSTLDISF